MEILVPAWLIDALKREEEERQQQEEANRPRIEIPELPDSEADSE